MTRKPWQTSGGIVTILRFEMNVPKQVALETPQGTFVEGRYGDRVMYVP